MPVIDTITKRMAAEANGSVNDVLVLGPIPLKLRNQLLHLLRNTFGSLPFDEQCLLWRMIWNAWDEERGGYQPADAADPMHWTVEKTVENFQGCSDSDAADFIDISARVIDTVHRRKSSSTGKADRALRDLNARLREARLAYRYEQSLGRLINIGSECTHEQIVRPALALLEQRGFEEAKREFRNAYDHTAEAKWKDAVTSAGRAYEAAMKAICKARRWAYEEKMVAAQLVSVCLDNDLIPGWQRDTQNAFVSMLKAGVPHVRNNAGGHGASPDTEAVTEELARYAINQAATNILLLLERHRALPHSA